MHFAQKAQKYAAAIIGLVLWLTPPVAASGLEVSPITLEVPAKGGTSSLQLVNRGGEPVAVQVEAFAWRQDAGREELAASDAIVISPPLAQLAPGQKQTIRLLVKPDPGAVTERSFRIIVSELPPPVATNSVRMLLQFSIPVFAGNASAAAKIEWAAEQRPDGVWIAARNTGAKRAKLRDLQFVTASASKGQSGTRLAYILAGATRAFKIQGVGAGQTVDIRARDQNDKMATLASVVVAR